MPRPSEPLVPRRDWKFESIEERLALSADPIADFWLNYAQDADLQSDAASELAGVLSTQAAEGHGWTDIANARTQFGLGGSGQTVAVIDSGIAYDHIALGGGLGAAYRVVGGWDFAENDANPYDDGPAGFHGTHVSGIIGAQDSRYAGVAPGADLVGLRVFDDQGNGYFTWVESALRWVHQNRFSFANPITTVNLSLGTDWNASTLPQWATLEDELKQLSDDGIFISVAAGNSFLAYNAAGLSYPAVSQWVTPVASVDANGNLSKFSQRADRVLAVPGEKIKSTLPDAFYGGDGNKNDWGAASGTSMAAPYLAGVSVLVREAMQDLGLTQITQSSIYNLLRNSADSIYDATTNATYRRVNVTKAFETLVGVDEYGGSLADSTAVGSLTSTLTVSGTIGRVSDQDFFRFTATQTGTATLSLGSSVELAAAWKATGGAGQISGSTLTLDVVAGQSYAVGVGGSGSHIGKYTVDLKLTPTTNPAASATNWGTVEQSQMSDISLSGGDKWFQVTAGRSGTFTVESFFAQSRGNVDISIYDAQQRLLGSSSGTGNSERVDFTATAGGTYYIKVVGSNSDVDFRLTNLVSFGGGVVDVAGTQASDAFQWTAATQQISVNGVSYRVAGANTIRFDGGAGTDAITLVGGTAAETVTLRPGSVQLVGGGMSVSATSVESTRVVGSLNDTALLYDSAGRDTLEAGLTSVTLRGTGFQSTVEGIGNVTVFATAGTRDLARLIGSSGNDLLTVSGATRELTGSGVRIRTENFQSVNFAGGGGQDTVDFYTDTRQSSLGGRGSSGWITALGYATEFSDVESVLANVRAGDRLSSDLAALSFVFKRIGVS